MTAKMGCKTCGGKGVVPHAKRKIGPEGARIDDPADLQTEELCATCGGGGQVPYVDESRTAYSPATFSLPQAPPPPPITTA